MILSPLARRDLVAILHYTSINWGNTQVKVYKGKLTAAIEALAENPGLGHRSHELPDTHRVYAVGSHVIVYRLDDQGGAVVRILHQRMSVAQHV